MKVVILCKALNVLKQFSVMAFAEAMKALLFNEAYCGQKHRKDRNSMMTTATGQRNTSVDYGLVSCEGIIMTVHYDYPMMTILWMFPLSVTTR
jgi:hypothetical protein